MLFPDICLGLIDRALRTALYEAHGVHPKWRKEIEWYHYNNRNGSASHALGISTYATLVTLVEGKASLNALLSDAATLGECVDAFGIIGYKVDLGLSVLVSRF